jgi:hypothetical protein
MAYYKFTPPNEAKDRLTAGVVKIQSGCWEWQKSINSSGYGLIRVNNKLWKTHRLSYTLYKGEIPKGEGYHGTCVLHKCDNRKCLNPDHLFLGTNEDNMKDAKLKGRLAGIPRPRGKISRKERENKAKVKHYGRIAIMTLRKNGVSKKYLANLFGVNRRTISGIVNGVFI